jgi:hypothetical protein
LWIIVDAEVLTVEVVEEAIARFIAGGEVEWEGPAILRVLPEVPEHEKSNALRMDLVRPRRRTKR